MKNILIPTDFSDNARKATLFAFEIFGKGIYKGRAAFTLLFAHQEPSKTTAPLYDMHGAIEETGVVDLDPVAQKKAQDECDNYQKSYPEFRIEGIAIPDNPVDAVVQYAKKAAINLIVMGTRGSGSFQRALIGSTANQVSHQAECPVAIIPEEASLGLPEKIVLATDFGNLKDLNILQPIKDMTQALDPELMMLHIYGEKKTPERERERMNAVLETYFSDVIYNHYFLEHRSPAAGIEEFIEGFHANLLVLIGQERNFFEHLFHKSVTRQLILHSKIPILVLHKSDKVDIGENFKQKVAEKMKEWKTDLEELNVQIHLGKAEAIDEFEKLKVRLGKFSREAMDKVSGLGKDSEAFKDKMKKGLEYLQSQLNMGKADSEENIEAQKEKIREAVKSVKENIAHEKTEKRSTKEKVADSLEEAIEKLQIKLDMLSVQVNLGKKDARDELEKRQKQAKEKMHELREKLDGVEDVAEDKWDHFRKEMKEAFGHVKKAFVGK